jgi:hypothetical protein
MDVEELEERIFYLRMADTLSSEDYRLIDELENKLKELKR